MNKKLIIIIVAAVGFVCVACIGLVALIGGGVFFLTQPLADASDDYLEALKTGDYATAYDLSAPNVQEELGSAEGLQRFVVENNFIPESWNFNDRSVENDTGTLTGTVTLADGTVVNTEINMAKIDGDWLVTGIHFNER